MTERSSHNMDSADQDPVQRALASQEALLVRHEAMFSHLLGQIASLTQAVARLTPLEGTPSVAHPAPQGAEAPAVEPAAAEVTAPSALEPGTTGLRLPAPEPFSGELSKCAGFLTQCSLVFRQQRRLFEDDGARIAFFVQLLRDRALLWAQAALKAHPDITYAVFLSKFKNVFEKGSGAEAAAHQLLNLKQGKRSMADYSIDFQILAEETGWGEDALRSTLLNNLCEELKDELTMRELPTSLDALMSLCVKVDGRLRARRSSRLYNFHEPSGQPKTAPGGAQAELREQREELDQEEPMQLGHSRVNSTERHRRLVSGECLFCGKKGHFVATCPLRSKGRARQ